MFDRLWNQFVNRETVSYLIFGVLTTAVDWVVYMLIRDFNYMAATMLGWAASVIFAFITNKLFVFQSQTLKPAEISKEFVSFATCRVLTGVFNAAGMFAMVTLLKLNDIFSKIVISAIVLILNYVFSKLFIFKNKTGKQG